MARVDLRAKTDQPLARSAVYLRPYVVGEPITATATCRYTALLSVAGAAGPRLESLLMLQPSRISLHEWRALSESARAGAQESLLSIANSGVIPAESTLAQEPLRSLRLESLETLAPNISGGLEGLGLAEAQTSALTEHLLGLQSARDEHQEVLGEAISLAERTSNQEWQLPVDSITGSPYENLSLGVIGEATLPQEALATTEHAASARLEHILPVSQQGLGNLEHILQVAGDAQALYDWLLDVTRGQGGSWEALTEIALALALHLEWFNTLGREAVSMLEYGLGVQQQGASSAESLVASGVAEGLAQAESAGSLAESTAAPWEALLQLAQPTLTHSELLWGVERAFEAQQEAPLGIQREPQVHAEHAQEIVLERAGALSWLLATERILGLHFGNARGISQALSAAVEILTTAQQDAEALVEIVLGLQQARETPHEALSESAAAVASRNVPHEALQPLSSALTSACESTLAAIVATTLATEQLIEQILSKAMRQENLLGRENQHAAETEALAGQAQQRAGYAESLASLQAARTPNLEQLIELARSISERLESLSAVVALVNPRTETLTLLQKAQQTITESLASLVKSSQGAEETLITLTRELAALYEQLSRIAPSTLARQEILGRIAVGRTARTEWLVSALRTLQERYESLFAAIPTIAAFFEHYHDISRSALAQLELLKLEVVVTRTALYEVLRGIRSKRSGQFEKRGRVHARRSAWQELWGIIETLKASDAEQARAQAKERTSQSQKPQAQADQARQAQTAHQQRPDTQADAERKSREAGGKRL